ncbi:MAG: DUF1499 domain-containing protein [Gammaproteobacteria bacterium]
MLLKLALALVVILVGLPVGAVLLNRVPLGEAPGPGARLAAYLTSNVRETRSDSPYPELRPRRYVADVERVRAAVLSAMDAMGWAVVPSDGSETAVMAVVTTRLWRFKDDVSVRVVAEGEVSRVDVRSASRVGKGDLGANTRHILDLYAELDHRLAGGAAR